MYCPARHREWPQPPLLLHQTADADLRPLAFLEALRVRAPELPPLVHAARRNIDRLQVALLQLAHQFANIHAIRFHLQAGHALHAAGSDHTCAVGAGGTLSCWGSNSQGQLGDGSIGGVRLTPVVVSGLSAVAMTTGAECSCGPLESNSELSALIAIIGIYSNS